MKLFKMNVITLSVIAVSSSAVAADFGVGNANTSSVNQSKYECKRCSDSNGYQGSVSVSVGYNDINDIHAGNAFGTAEDGVIAAVSGNVRYQDESGYRGQLQAHQLGMDNGFLSLQTGKTGLYELAFDYSTIKTYQAGDVESQLWHNNGMLTPSMSVHQFDLALEREKIGLGFDYGRDFYNAFAHYSQEDKTGHLSSSILTPSPVNFGLPVDATTKQWDAGLALNGDNWITELSYMGSFYENNINHLSLPHLKDVYSASPDNQAHQVSLSGQYQLNRTVMSGRLVSGRMIQDDDLIQMSGNPLQNWDGQVDTLDGRLAVTSMLINRLRLGASVDYSKRDNKSSVAEFAQYKFNSVTGAFRQNTPRDYEHNNYKVNASYRIASGYRLLAGYNRKEVDRSFSEREQTHDDSLWMEFNIRALDNFNINLKAEHAERGGSKYETDALTSSEQNALMRKYYLANRTRNALELRVSHSPLNWLSVDMSTRYAKDDYNETQIGLTESEDYGYDMNLSLQLSKHANAYGFVGQQWINSAQASSQFFAQADWYNDIEDEFTNIGVGLSYGGLMQEQLTLGLDYLFSNSVSDTYVTTEGTRPYGDYYSYNHSASVYADYALNEQMALKLSYRYERYYDTDAAVTHINNIPGLVTLGDINHNYNAHQVMLSFSYKLR
ncbi:MtrB/PioB family decaheme-associated outer membrane protein [Shewanella sp. Isolate13]|uniref:MtrB/PioB family decaheme-associated outer membrane protein n=1 Tax=Shewanella sp. Isolate13 TaxID=2908531 RepID=UPI001EFED805|nr:MtrB/PioB family decaheme-associated outer membrane protein [Shewanella sp. Isolate13]MCG9729527.1 MtrB/PioB family decaheme-associated outer membrane protein [Shewanella sp. Isolate13]